MPENKQKKKNRALWIILLILFAVIFAVVAAGLIIHLLPGRGNLDNFKQPVSSTPELALADNPIDFDALHEENPDVCGWITLDGTVIDYPILRSGTDKPEDYYLDRDIKGAYKRAGSIYIQRMNSDDFTDNNTVIYGHNMLNGTMFAALKKYRNKQFFEDNPEIKIYAPGHIYTYKIFSAFVYDDRHILNSFDFDDEEEYQDFLDDCLNPPTLIKNVRDDITVTTDDKIIVLSTCTSVKTERYLVVAVMVDDTLTK